MPRFAVLEHTGAPDDPAGLHYDLLLEQGPRCRTWRLATIPVPGGPDVVAVELPPHRPAWLDHEAGDVSGGRGFARRIDAGAYALTAVADSEASRPVVVHITLHGERFSGELVLSKHADQWLARLAGPRTP